MKKLSRNYLDGDEVICHECGAVVEDGVQCEVCGALVIVDYSDYGDYEQSMENIFDDYTDGASW
jgi:hypothetical protein